MENVDRESLGLIEEFIAQAEVGAVMHHKYRVHLQEYARWLARIATRPVIDATPGDVRRYMAYLKGGDRFAATRHHRVSGDLSASARKNMLSSIDTTRKHYAFASNARRRATIFAYDPQKSAGSDQRRRAA